MPEGPAITAWRALDMSADLMDRAFKVRRGKARIRTNTRRNFTIGREKLGPWLNQPALYKRAKRHFRLRAFGLCNFDILQRAFIDFFKAAARMDDIFFFHLKADEFTAQFFRNCPRCPRSKEGINNNITRIRSGENNPGAKDLLAFGLDALFYHRFS